MQFSLPSRLMMTLVPWTLIGSLALHSNMEEDIFVSPEYGERYERQWIELGKLVSLTKQTVPPINTEVNTAQVRRTADLWIEAERHGQVTHVPRVASDDTMRQGVRGQVGIAIQAVMYGLHESIRRSESVGDDAAVAQDCYRILALAQIQKTNDLAFHYHSVNAELFALKHASKWKEHLPTQQIREVNSWINSKAQLQLWKQAVASELAQQDLPDEVLQRAQKDLAVFENSLRQPKAMIPRISVIGYNSNMMSIILLARFSATVIREQALTQENRTQYSKATSAAETDKA